MLCVYGFLGRPGQRCGINRKDMGEVFGPMGVIYMVVYEIGNFFFYIIILLSLVLCFTFLFLIIFIWSVF